MGINDTTIDSGFDITALLQLQSVEIASYEISTYEEVILHTAQPSSQPSSSAPTAPSGVPTSTPSMSAPPIALPEENSGDFVTMLTSVIGGVIVLAIGVYVWWNDREKKLKDGPAMRKVPWYMRIFGHSRRIAPLNGNGHDLEQGSVDIDLVDNVAFNQIAPAPLSISGDPSPEIDPTIPQDPPDNSPHMQSSSYAKLHPKGLYINKIVPHEGKFSAIMVKNNSVVPELTTQHSDLTGMTPSNFSDVKSAKSDSDSESSISSSDSDSDSDSGSGSDSDSESEGTKHISRVIVRAASGV